MNYNHNEIGLTPHTKKLWDMCHVSRDTAYPHWTKFADNQYAGTSVEWERRDHFEKLAAGRDEARNQRRG